MHGKARARVCSPAAVNLPPVLMQIVRMLAQAGGPRLPWEGESAAAVEALTRPFWRPLMQLLNRDPACRSTARKFHYECSALAL